MRNDNVEVTLRKNGVEELRKDTYDAIIVLGATDNDFEDYVNVQTGIVGNMNLNILVSFYKELTGTSKRVIDIIKEDYGEDKADIVLKDQIIELIDKLGGLTE